MKKIVGLILFLALSSPLYAAGPFDGVYSASINGFVSNYVSVHEIENQIVVIIVDPNPNNTWEPMIGTRIGNNASLTNIPGVSPSDINLNVTVNFSDTGTSTATINSCTDGVVYVCVFPSGLTLNLDKIF